MTKKAEKYANLPDYVMGLTCSRHRVQDMKQILRYHNQRFMSTATKPELLGVMSVLEKTLRTPELAFVTSWLNIKGRKVNFYTAKARATQPLQKPRRRPESNEEKEQVEDESDIVSTNSSEPTECSVCMESFLSSPVSSGEACKLLRPRDGYLQYLRHSKHRSTNNRPSL